MNCPICQVDYFLIYNFYIFKHFHFSYVCMHVFCVCENIYVEVYVHDWTCLCNPNFGNSNHP